MALRYVGGGTYIVGVPARDLTDEEERQFGGAIAEQQRITGLRLYESLPAKRAGKVNEESGDKSAPEKGE